MLTLMSMLLPAMATYRSASRLVLLHDPTQPDLPCPWCHYQTTEDDRACAGCGQRFG